MDRFGEPPRSVQNLLSIAWLKAMAHENYLTELTQKGDEIRFVFYEKARVDAGKIDGFLKDYRGKMKFTVDANPYFTYLKPRKSGRDNEDILTLVREILERMRELVKE